MQNARNIYQKLTNGIKKMIQYLLQKYANKT